MRQNFIRCGLTGLFIEIFFTGMGALFAHDYSMTGHSSIIMFPIYGSAAFIEPIWRRLCNKPIVLRGLIYTICIYRFCDNQAVFRIIKIIVLRINILVFRFLHL